MQPRSLRFLRDLARDECVTIRVSGDCMEPLIAAGALVSVRRRRIYLPGDVIVFETRGGSLAAHRVLGYRARGLVTQGDRCTLHDAPVSRGAIVGAIESLRIPPGARGAAMIRFAAIVVRRLTR